MEPLQSPLPLRLAAALTFAALVACFVLLSGGPTLHGEDGPIEVASVIAYLGAAACFVLGAPDGLRDLWQIPATLLLAAGRELDLDKSLLSEGMLMSRFYFGDAPLWEKAVGLAVVAFALWTGWRLVRHGTGPALRAIRDGAAWAVLAAGAVLALVVAKTFDGFARKLRPLGVEVSDALNRTLSLVEEWLELGASVALLLAVLSWVRVRDAGQDREEAAHAGPEAHLNRR